MMTPSLRSKVDPFRAMDVLAEANRMIAAGERVLSLAVGQPAAPAPDAAIDAARAMLGHGRVAYTDALGRRELRERISRYYLERHGLAVDASRIMVTTGSSAGFNLAFLAAFDPGDRIAIASPGYPAYRNILKVLGLEPVEIPVGVETDYIFTAAHLQSAHEEKPVTGVLVASPANPTGTVTPPEELARLVTYADAQGIRFISDEIYHGLTYGGEEASALAFSEHPIVVNSFSKYYCMTGWRIGWLVLPPELVRAAERIGQSLYISAPEISQVAATAVFDAAEELDRVRDGYVRNRDLLIQRLPELGFRDIAPIDGAFYAYAGIPEGWGGSTEFARSVLHETHVAITPGTDFDLVRGESFVRLSYACDYATLEEALGGIRRFTQRR
ncbi:pyridoxal phosphate-dependent aminotransferase [Aurantimonas sp. VKM B-3413]|uniref:pyridoxal phosphate-dependent aminotransferase n=1 Tax=Aurantimonas sp. VKM B-3413 TaxID=2779401 RepID=UPI001E2FD110|nr:aminotransferase class I/II-fold pyridoxal phosphate-dependent enzyme [Aurantimonas sp. VKM B-3413]MCB8839854.1 aminotransferase class I/II-fold pyridoxal phosphate-dependent enzyme [Aurantimonas sp. VKM B-3413]